MFDGSVWTLSIDWEYRGQFKAREEAEAEAKKIFTEPKDNVGSVPGTFLDEVIAVFGGRLLDDNEL